ncbi:putative receptor-like protein kinase At3g47110 [Durio zibethinus]|uniref:Receptor-like protein kinase At3g47110 n=1 Tax=Durio zibethinus TaxID=66656 RepID=A0A6P6ALW1_DURZI|nr:putative receptor-like protein kinase At3g47110 [Durio zibethinus]
MVEEFIVPVLKIGLSGSAISPTEGMAMTVVVNKLNDIKDRMRTLRATSPNISYDLKGILLLWMTSCLEFAIIHTFANEYDGVALLDFKNQPIEWKSSNSEPVGSKVSWLHTTFHRKPYIPHWNQPQKIGFNGEIPQEIGRLLRLQHLNLTYNFLGGKIPTDLTDCTELKTLGLGGNGFIGQIPSQLNSLSELRILELGANNLTGTIPTWIGIIPEELSKLSGSGIFQLYGNCLSSTVPPPIYNISSIYYFSVTQNQFQGHLPQDVGITLPNLQVFAGGVNNFTGAIPVSLANASKRQIIDFAENGLTGTIPENLGSLGDLIRLNFDDNKLGNGKSGDLSFFNFLTNFFTLEVLGLAGNRFGGELPSPVANLSDKLKIFTIGSNLIHGSNPTRIGNLVNLYSLEMECNHLSGTVPDVVGKLQKLEGLHLNFNRFSGSIPFSFGNLTSLIRLFMEDNRFEGNIPPSLGNCQNLLVLNFSIEVGNLNNLVELDLAENRLSGEIPNSLTSRMNLERLYLESNGFEGIIPLSLKSLRGLEEIDLSRNNLSGQIPEFLSKIFSLRHLNLSHNDFQGEVSQAGIFANVRAFSVVGNNRLCGGVQVLHLPTCTRKIPRRRLPSKIVIFITSAVIFFVLACSLSSYYLVRNLKSQSSASSSKERQFGIISTDGTFVAIKVLNLQQQGASRSFIDECNVLRNMQCLHPEANCAGMERHELSLCPET